jgi:hypothetical protein
MNRWQGNPMYYQVAGHVAALTSLHLFTVQKVTVGVAYGLGRTRK